MKSIENIIRSTNEKNESEIDWTSAWSKKYPVLATYQDEVDIEEYSTKIKEMLNSLKEQYGYSKLDSMLILKDILYHEWKDNK